MDNVIRFIGIITFTLASESGHLEAILPRLAGDSDVPKHDSFILFPPGAATSAGEPWPIHRLTTVDGDQFDYVDLRGGTITFNSTGDVLNKVPSFLPRLNDDCCGMMGDLKPEYVKHDDPRYTNAHVVLEHGTADWLLGDERLDTLIDLKSNGPLIITREHDGKASTLRFTGNAVLAIGNFPLDDIKYGASHGHHFDAYYRMVRRGFFCGKSDMPSTDEDCRRKIPRGIKVRIKPVLHGLKGADIDCSNSGYP